MNPENKWARENVLAFTLELFLILLKFIIDARDAVLLIDAIHLIFNDFKFVAFTWHKFQTFDCSFYFYSILIISLSMILYRMSSTNINPDHLWDYHDALSFELFIFWDVLKNAFTLALTLNLVANQRAACKKERERKRETAHAYTEYLSLHFTSQCRMSLIEREIRV